MPSSQINPVSNHRNLQTRSEGAVQRIEPSKAPPVRLRALKSVACALLGSRPVRLSVGVAFGDSGIPFRGTRIRTESRMSFAGPLLLAGKYERAEIDFISKYLPNDLDVLEVGSSIGATACQIARRLAPGRRLTCVEANPKLIPVLLGNISANVPDRVIQVVHAVVGAETGKAYFVPSIDSLSSLATESTTGALELRCETLSDLALAHCPGDFALVSDVEGAEAAFLADERALRRCRFMVIEAHATRHQGKDLSTEDVIAMPLGGGKWRIKDRYGPVVAYERIQDSTN